MIFVVYFCEHCEYEFGDVEEMGGFWGWCEQFFRVVEI